MSVADTVNNVLYQSCCDDQGNNLQSKSKSTRDQDKRRTVSKLARGVYSSVEVGFKESRFLKT